MTIGLLLEKAARSLDAAERLLQAGDNDFGASRTYYGYFYIAQALLLSMGLSYGRHGQVIAQYGLHFAKTQRLDPAFHRFLDRAFEIRHTADYETLPIEPDRVEELIREGRRFLAAASEYLKGIHESEAPAVPLAP
jgi:uncharacterized protein (UPF0332 family)